MSLGVLNNLSAMYAANNLSNSNNNLSKTLQQLSSGSKINSGSDDAAGLSLVNGLQANATALAQSQTNAQEGVGLLQVADGALSQVTNLLNRAVTLATEVSNGTLNSAQQSAANQEYQSILSEISNIGSTTTYNQNRVFNTDVSIYTGDSSTTGASQDTLHLANLSSSSVGDKGGSMQYSAGKGVFINLSADTTHLASGSDTLKGGNLTFKFWDPAGAGSAQTATITVADGETVDTLINQINQSGLGVTAGFVTAAQANGTPGAAGLEGGIMITGNVTAAAAPTQAGDAMYVQTTTYDDLVAGGNQLAAASPANTTGSTIATISYNASGDTSVNLSVTDLTSQANAQGSLNALNTAISAVAAQQGYIGAQINTLNAVSNVMSTQQQNIVGAQNAVQATDYASAASAMSKYQILSQTGISALAQANSMQQEVLKLLQ